MERCGRGTRTYGRRSQFIARLRRGHEHARRRAPLGPRHAAPRARAPTAASPAPAARRRRESDSRTAVTSRHPASRPSSRNPLHGACGEATIGTPRGGGVAPLRRRGAPRRICARPAISVIRIRSKTRGGAPLPLGRRRDRRGVSSWPAARWRAALHLVARRRDSERARADSRRRRILAGRCLDVRRRRGRPPHARCRLPSRFGLVIGLIILPTAKASHRSDPAASRSQHDVRAASAGSGPSPRRRRRVHARHLDVEGTTS